MLEIKSTIHGIISGILISLILTSCNLKKEPTKTISQMKDVSRVTLYQIVDNTRIEKRTLISSHEIRRFLDSFAISSQSKSELDIKVKEGFNKNGEIDIVYGSSYRHLVIEIDLAKGYRISLNGKIYYEPFTYQTGRIIVEYLAESNNPI